VRDKGSAGNGVGNSREEIKTVLAGSREIASDTSKRDSAIHSAKASGYFLTHFYHAYVLLCLIIRKRDTHVMQKRQAQRTRIDRDVSGGFELWFFWVCHVLVLNGGAFPKD